MLVPFIPRLFATVLVVSGISGVVVVVAQEPEQPTNVTCTANPWTFNENNQSPCLVASRLQQLCSGVASTLPPLKSTTSGYLGPSLNEANQCSCSSVTYSLVSACALCQNGGYFSWTMWKKNCSSEDAHVGSFPFAIPGDLSVPAWAYNNVTGTGTFDKQTAQQEADSSATPDIVGNNTPTLAATTPSMTASPSPTPSKPNVGAIAGGVVGGVVGVLVVILLAIILLRQRYSRVPQEERHIIQPYEVQPPSLPKAMTSITPLKLYNPADPTTYPPQLDFDPNNLPPYTTSSVVAVSPTSNVYSPTSGANHNRNFSGATTISSSSTSNVNASSPVTHGRNISAESGATAPTTGLNHDGAFHPTLSNIPAAGHPRKVK